MCLNNELYNSGVAILNESFKEIYDDFVTRKCNEAQTPHDIAKTLPIEIVSIEDVFELLAEAIQKKGYAHVGCFFKHEPSTVARDSRITRRKVYTDFRQLVCFRGELYERDNDKWVERKLLKDTKEKWHIWDGTYNVAIWLDHAKRVMTTNVPKPTKIYPIES